MLADRAGESGNQDNISAGWLIHEPDVFWMRREYTYLFEEICLHITYETFYSTVPADTFYDCL